MPQKFTPNQLIALLYNETTPGEKNEILREIINAPVLADELAELSETIKLLEGAELDPDPTSLSIIMEYSAKTHEIQHA